MPSPSKNLESALASTSATLKISFTATSPQTVITTTGTKVPKGDAKLAPSIYLKPTSPSKTYLAISLDPDAPFPSFPILGPILHGLHTDLTADGAPDADGWVELKGVTIAEWVPPAPPPISSAHRYVFMVFEQPASVSEEKLRKDLGFADKVSLGQRIRWDQKGFETKFGLGAVVAVNSFLCG